MSENVFTFYFYVLFYYFCIHSQRDSPTSDPTDDKTVNMKSLYEIIHICTAVVDECEE